MYKKITHTIVEEHFDHPIGGQIKKTLEKSKIVTNEIFSESDFRTKAHNYFESYINNIGSLVSATTGTDEDLMVAFDNIFKTAWIDDLGNMTKPIYPTEFGERINEVMRVIATGVLLGIQLIKTGKDSGQTANRIQFAINDLAQNLNNFNNAWQYGYVGPMLNSLVADLFNLAKALIAKNSSLEQQLTQHISSVWSNFEKVLVDGIITQHPERFNRTPTLPEIHSKDIM